MPSVNLATVMVYDAINRDIYLSDTIGYHIRSNYVCYTHSYCEYDADLPAHVSPDNTVQTGIAVVHCKCKSSRC